MRAHGGFGLIFLLQLCILGSPAIVSGTRSDTSVSDAETTWNFLLARKMEWQAMPFEQQLQHWMITTLDTSNAEVLFTAANAADDLMDLEQELAVDCEQDPYASLCVSSGLKDDAKRSDSVGPLPTLDQDRRTVGLKTGGSRRRLNQYGITPLLGGLLGVAAGPRYPGVNVNGITGYVDVSTRECLQTGLKLVEEFQAQVVQPRRYCDICTNGTWLHSDFYPHAIMVCLA